MAQKTINTHGYKMTNLREICALTKGMRKGSGYHIEIAWDSETGHIAYEEHIGTVGDQRVIWSKEMITCGFLQKPTTQQQIADQITRCIEGQQ